LPSGLIYEGVDAYGGKAQFFRGETGAQSSIIPCLDALLGIQHADDPLREYLLEMQEYMPPNHRRLIADLGRGPSLRDFVLRHRSEQYALVQTYNDCVTWVAHFRSKHLEYAAAYIHNQSQRDLSNPSAIGTGGTPFMPYLKKHRDESRWHLVE
jgi:indoleamine 2,3-dioxygenase